MSQYSSVCVCVLSVICVISPVWCCRVRVVVVVVMMMAGSWCREIKQEEPQIMCINGYPLSL